MKKRLTEKINIGMLFSLITILICFLMLFKNFPLCRYIIEKATLISAKTVLVSANQRQYTTTEAIANTEETKSTESESEKETGQTEQTQADQQSDDQSKKTNSGALIDEDFTSEPEDIKKLIDEYSEKADKDKKDGSITEMKYTKSGATDSYKNVRIKNVNDTNISINELLEKDPDIEITDKSQPSVLIYHTHTTESYQILDRSFYAQGYLSRSDDSAKNMIRVGEEICRQLEKQGFSVIHDKTVYDKKYSGAYQRSRVTVEEYLKKYPSIQITLDIHRDAIQYNNGTKVKPVSDVLGKKCAQMMIISGCQENGNGITGFEDWEYNLIFAVHLQKTLEDMFPGIMRPLYFCPRRYNMNVNHCSLLVEMGSDANTLAEGVYAGKCLGTALASLMEKYCEE